MRFTLISLAMIALAGTASASEVRNADSGDAAFALLSEYKADIQKPNYIRLQSSIAPSEASIIDTKISEIYGAPTTTRLGLKVWEMENTSASGGQQTTIMCGPDGKGGLLISADRRGPSSRGANSRNKAKRKIARQQTSPRRARSASKPAVTDLSQISD